MAGLVASGKFNFKSHSDDHDLGSSGSRGLRDVDGEAGGKTWGIQLPGLGTVFHESGNFMQTVTVHGPEPRQRKNRSVYDDAPAQRRGNQQRSMSRSSAASSVSTPSSLHHLVL